MIGEVRMKEVVFVLFNFAEERGDTCPNVLGIRKDFLDFGGEIREEKSAGGISDPCSDFQVPELENGI